MENKPVLTEATMPSAAFTAALVSTLKAIDEEYLAVKRENESVVELFLSLLDRQVRIQLVNLEKAGFQVSPSVQDRTQMIVPTLRASLRKSLTLDVLTEIVAAGGMLNPQA